MVHSLAPRSQHPLSGVLETVKAIHRLANRRSGVRNSVTDSLHHQLLLPVGNAEVSSDELRESFSRQPRLLAAEHDAGGIVSVSGIDRGREEIVGGSKTGIVPRCVEQRDVLGVAIGVPQGVGQQQHRGQLLEGLVLVSPRHVRPNSLRDSLPRGFVLLGGAVPPERQRQGPREGGAPGERHTVNRWARRKSASGEIRLSPHADSSQWSVTTVKKVGIASTDSMRLYVMAVTKGGV